MRSLYGKSSWTSAGSRYPLTHRTNAPASTACARVKNGPEIAGHVPFFQLASCLWRETAWENCDVEILPHGDHRSAQRRHQVLTADQRTDTSDVGLIDLEVLSITLSPNIRSANVGINFR